MNNEKAPLSYQVLHRFPALQHDLRRRLASLPWQRLSEIDGVLGQIGQLMEAVDSE
jgi:hypothetical protein